jgi:peptidyl-prolyl cis-trans isomerase B (cyclophilin B)
MSWVGETDMFRMAAAIVVTIVVGPVNLFLSGQDAGGKNPIVIMETSLGTMKLELLQDKAPITVKNFLSYVDKKHYDGTIFHQIIPEHIILGGGFAPGLKEKETGKPIINEAANGVSNLRGTIGMVRMDRAHSARSQFYINVNNNLFLDKANDRQGIGHCVFGKVIEGIEVIDKIKNVPTGPVGKMEGVPKEDVLIKSVRRAN